MTLLRLPDELLHQVALYFEGSDVASYASTCRATRASTRSLLFRTLTVASVSKLESLSNADAAILGYMRHFNIRLEYDFFEAFAAACDSTAFPHSTALRHQSLLPALAHILLSAPQLGSLRVQIPESADSCASAWPQLLRLNTQGVALGPALARVLPQNITFPNLRLLHLDGISHLGSLVRMTPNIISLSAHMCEGFSEQACRELVDSVLPLAPRLEELAFDPFSLHFGSDLNVPKAITAAAPHLETLDLRSRAFDYSSGRTEWRTMDRIDPLDCVPSGSKLKELHLPFAPSVVETSALDPHKAHMLDDRARETEFVATLQLASASPMQKVSWLRADGDEPVEYVIERDEEGIPVHITVLGATPIEQAPVSDPQSAAGLCGLATMLANVASNTVFHAAVVMWMAADSTALQFTAIPALLATGVAFGLASRVRA